MADPIVDFIKKAQSKGHTRSDIEKVLQKKGWSAQQIKAGFSQVGGAAAKPAAAGAAKLSGAEKTIQKYSQECGKYQLWKKLPRKMMYQTFQVILDYLEEAGKIMIDDEGCVIWTYDPQTIKRLISEGLVAR